ncbi:MAG TPA: SWIM zinc finger family protein [Bacillota bacterium]|nr:SWIM zinc finger family protein [Bacillota bacterium]
MARKDEFGGTWWAKRWTSALERLGWSSRLQRGRTYARQGNVLEVKVSPGRIDARVQGSRRRPYRVTINIEPLSDSDWNEAASAMAEHASFAARLLAGEMPENIEDAFDRCDTPLFPGSEQDIEMSCTCPDWANPCKHTAAVFYVLGTEFDRDPFLLFLLRGMSKERLLAALREKRAQAAASTEASAAGARADGNRAEGGGSKPDGATESSGNTSEIGPDVVEQFLPLIQEGLDSFWAGDAAAAESLRIDVTAPETPLGIIKRLGVPEFWARDRVLYNSDFIAIMKDYYQTVTRRALALAYRDTASAEQADKTAP